jgi:hypothetical protein
MAFSGHRATQRGGRLIRQPYSAHPELAPDLDHQPGDGRVNMDVLVAVDMVERQPGRAERFELGANFRRKLPARRGREVEAKPGAHHVRVKLAVRSDERGNLRCRQDRRPVRQHQMQSDAERRQPFRARNGVGGRRLADHQARDRQNTVAMGLLDGLVDGDVPAEIVGADDKAFHASSAPRRSAIHTRLVRHPASFERAAPRSPQNLTRNHLRHSGRPEGPNPEPMNTGLSGVPAA